MIVAEATYEVTDPTIDSQIVTLQASGADIFFNITTPKFARAGDPQGATTRLEAAALPQQRRRLGRLGAEAGRPRQGGQGHRSRSATYKDPTDPQWKDDRRCKEWRAFMDKYYPDGDLDRRQQRATATSRRRRWCRC